MKNPPKKRKPTKQTEYGYSYEAGGETYTKWCRDENERNKAVKDFKKNPKMTNVKPIQREINPPK